jgi:polygalacturonase
MPHLSRFLPALLLAASPLFAAAPSGTYSPADYGAVFDGKTNDGPAIQQAIDAAAAAGGGTVVLPAGRTALSGSIELKSHLTLRLEPGSRLVASLNRGDYSTSILVRAVGAEEVAITGTGTIEGQGEAFMASRDAVIFHPKDWRPNLVMFRRCRHVRLSDFTLHDSPRFTIQFAGCEDVEARGLTIRNNVEIPNCDGIDPVCSRDVRITGCSIETGDDCVAISTGAPGPDGKPYDPMPAENIIVSDCVLTTQDSALKIGSGTPGDVRNVVFADCVVRRALRGVDIMARDGGNVENVVARNIVIQTQLYGRPWWGASEAVYVTAVPRNAQTKLGHVRGVHVSGIVAHGEAGVFVRGTPDSPIEDITLSDITLDIAKTTTWPSRIDLRPTMGQRGPDEQDVVVAGFDLQDVRGATIRDCAVRWGPNPPADFGPVLQQVRVADLTVENLRGRDAHAPAAKGGN